MNNYLNISLNFSAADTWWWWWWPPFPMVSGWASRNPGVCAVKVTNWSKLCPIPWSKSCFVASALIYPLCPAVWQGPHHVCKEIPTFRRNEDDNEFPLSRAQIGYQKIPPPNPRIRLITIMRKIWLNIRAEKRAKRRLYSRWIFWCRFNDCLLILNRV